jgi:putative FmdB family regulatory protein
MPTYEYTCDKCGHDFELFRSMMAPPLKQCPENLCAKKKWGKGKVTKKMSAGAGLLFKGDGFYITDYRSDKYKASAKKEAGEGKPAPKAEAKAETKPATKADKK